MKKFVIAAVVAAFALPAAASEIEAQCEAYVAENGGDPSGCPCLADAAAANPSLAAALMKIETPADFDAASDATKAAIAACFPGA